MKSPLAIFFLVLGLVSMAKASVTFTISDLGGGIASNFANAAGTVTNGMRWGIVVDTSNNGFSGSGLNYDAYAAGVNTAGFLGAGGVTSDDYFIPSSSTSFTSNSSPWEDAGAPGHFANGSIMDDLNDVTLPNGTSTSAHFAIVWFSDNTSAANSKYGFFTDNSFVVPPDSGAGVYGNVFLGDDPTRSATNTFAVAGVPEPSRMLLAGFGVLGLMMRRRRSV